MSVDVDATIVIERPIDVVADDVGDLANAPRWRRNVDEVTWTTEPPVRLGSQVLVRGRFLGRAFTTAFEIVELTPGEQIAIRTVASQFPIQVTCTCRPVGDRVTHVTLRHRGTPSGPRRLLTPIVTRALRRSTRRDLATLKRLLEP